MRDATYVEVPSYSYDRDFQVTVQTKMTQFASRWHLYQDYRERLILQNILCQWTVLGQQTVNLNIINLLLVMYYYY